MDRFAQVFICVPVTGLEVYLLEELLCHCHFQEISCILVWAATLDLEGLKLCQELINSLAGSLAQMKQL